MKTETMRGWKVLLLVLSLGGLMAWSYWDPTALHRSMPSAQSTLYPIDLRGYDAGARVLADTAGMDAEVPDAQVLLDVDGVFAALRTVANVEASVVTIGGPGGYSCEARDGGVECGQHVGSDVADRKLILASSEGTNTLEIGWFDLSDFQRTVFVDSSGNATFNNVVTAAAIQATSSISAPTLQTAQTETSATGYAFLPCPSIDAGTGYAPSPADCTTNTEGRVCVSRNAIWRCGTGTGCDGGAAGGCWMQGGL